MKKSIFISLISIVIVIFIVLFYLFIIKKEFILPKENIEKIEYKSTYKEKNINIKYGNKLLGYKKVKNIKKLKEDKIDTEKIGKYKIKYQAKIKNKKINFTKIVEVVDREKPVIKVNKEEPIYVCKGSEKIDLEIEATDNYDGDLKDKIIKQLKGDKLIIKVSDSSNNETVKILNVEYKDIEKPVIKINGNKIETILLYSNYKDKKATAYDNCDKDITDKIEIKNNVNTNKIGTYKVIYEVKDNGGNIAHEERTVRVIKPNNTNNNGKIIYLTFDDGPYMYTDELLNILKKYNVKATFFVTYQYPKYAYLIKREYMEGHSVAIHSYSHNYKTVYSSIDGYFNDLDKMNNIIKRETGTYSKLVRLPGGSSNTVSRKYKKGIMTDITSELTSRGYTYFDWNVSSGDAGETTSTDKVINNVVRSMNSGKTLVVLQHDVKKFSVDAVETIIKEGLARGYTFKALNSDSFSAHQHINN